MSLQCPTSPVYHTSAEQKQRAKNAAKLYRYGSPKLRDLLREKCRIRIREARWNSYEKGRNMNSFSRKLEILREEVADIEQDIELQEAIYQELLDEVNDWFVGQFEEEEIYAIGKAENNDVVCPICQKDILTNTNDKSYTAYRCNCGAKFNFNGDIVQLYETLQQKVNIHEQNCVQPLAFFVEPCSNGQHMLNAMCAKCDYFCSL